MRQPTSNAPLPRGPRARPGTLSLAAAAVALVTLLASAPTRAAEITVHVEAFQRAGGVVPAEVAVDGEPAQLERVDAPGTVTLVDVEDGTRVVMVSAPGFDSESVSVLASGTVALRVQLFPAADVRLDGVVVDASGAPSSGVELSLAGPRITAPLRTVSASDGSYGFEGVPAGIYALDARLGTAPTVRRSDVRLLGDSTVNVQLPDLSARPDVREFRRPVCSSAPAAHGLVAWVALLALTRRRR